MIKLYRVDKYVTVATAANHHDVKKETIRYHIKHGRFPHTVQLETGEEGGGSILLMLWEEVQKFKPASPGRPRGKPKKKKSKK